MRIVPARTVSTAGESEEIIRDLEFVVIHSLTVKKRKDYSDSLRMQYVTI